MTLLTPVQSPPETIAITSASRGARGFLAWWMAPERRGPLLVAPAIITLVVVNIFPLLWSYGLSFFNYNAKRIAVPPRWIGLGNYVDLFTDPDVWGRFINTAVIVIGSVALQLVIGFLLALLFAREFPLRRYLLMLVPSASSSSCSTSRPSASSRASCSRSPASRSSSSIRRRRR
jgi:multiple sugar transport system permease protein